jgi:hypothetical protein
VHLFAHIPDHHIPGKVYQSAGFNFEHSFFQFKTQEISIATRSEMIGIRIMVVINPASSRSHGQHTVKIQVFASICSGEDFYLVLRF